MHLSEGIPGMCMRKGRRHRKKIEQAYHSDGRGNREKSEGEERKASYSKKEMTDIKLRR